MANETRQKLGAAQRYETMESWADQALRRIWLRKEREKLRTELMDHYADRYEAYRSCGFDSEQSRLLAVECMGDPEEAGALLARVHQPLLSLLLRIARVLVLLLAVLTVFSFARHYLSLRPLQSLDTQTIAEKSRSADDGVSRTAVCRRQVSADAQLRFGDFTLAFETGSCCRYFAVYRDQRYGNVSFGMKKECQVLLSWTGKPWERMPAALAERLLRVEDNRGVQYQPLAEDAGTEGAGYLLHTGRIRPNAWGSLFSFSGMEQEPDWLEFILNDGGTEKRLRVHFAPWEANRKELEPVKSLDRAAETLRRMKPEGLPFSIFFDEQDSRGAFTEAEAEGKLRVLWARETDYQLDVDALNAFLGEQPADLQYPPDTAELVECGLLIRDYPDSFLIDPEQLAQQLRITAVKYGVEADFCIGRNPLFYSDAILFRLDWIPLDGERYELVYTDPVSGEAWKTAFVLDREEDAP